MANKRIYELTDEQTSYDENIQVAVSDSSFTSGDKKMKLINIYKKIFKLDPLGDYNPATTLLRADTGSGAEKKVAVKDLLEDSDTVNIIKGLGDTGWKTYAAGDVAKVSATIDANLFAVNVRERLGIIVLTGTIRLTGAPSQDDVMFTLPSSISTPTADIWFAACDTQQGSDDDDVYEFYVKSGERQVRQFANESSFGNQAVFCVTYFAG